MFTKPSFRPSVCGRFHANGFRPPKKNKVKMFSFQVLRCCLFAVYDVTWVLLRRYVVTIVIRQRVTTHLGLPHPATVPSAPFHLQNEIKTLQENTSGRNYSILGI